MFLPGTSPHRPPYDARTQPRHAQPPPIKFYRSSSLFERFQLLMWKDQKAEKAGLHEARSSEVTPRKSKLTVNLSFRDHQSSMEALMSNI